MSQHPILTVRELRKSYGKTEILHGINLSVSAGEILALVGPNGAGKSTTLKVISTLLRPDAGSVLIDGYNIAQHAHHARSIMTYLPEESGSYKNMTGERYLKFTAQLYFSDATAQVAAIERAIAIADLGPAIHKKASTYSKGMTRKLLLARAMMPQPKLVILDEPTSGLDITNARALRQCIRALADNGTAVLLSSHNMLEVALLADQVALMDAGTIHVTGSPKKLLKDYHAENLEDVFVQITQHHA
jgi:ABC-2 type transport system ATP-binding protein